MNPKVFLYVGVPAMLLTIAGSLSPGWIRVRPTNTAISSTDMGLYYLCSDGACEPYSSAANNYSTYAHEREYIPFFYLKFRLLCCQENIV